MEKYEMPDMEVVRFEQEDVITLSVEGEGAGDSGDFGDLFGD